MSRAFIFPGQGAQTIGMGRDLAEAYPAAKAVFDEVDEALGEKLSALIWEGEADELTLTQNAQPALMATSLAAMRALEAEGVSISDAAFVAGHSLGEYSALCAAGALEVGALGKGAGRGAGGGPTASAVLGDLIDAATNKFKGTHASVFASTPAPIISAETGRSQAIPRAFGCE